MSIGDAAPSKTKSDLLSIVHYLPGIRLAQGGVVRAVLDGCAVAADRGHQVTLFTYEPDDVPTEWMDFTRVPGRPRAIALPVPRRPGKLLSRAAVATVEETLRSADVLHLHAPWLDGNRQLANAASRLGVPYVVTLHGMLDDWSMSQRGFKKRLYMRLFGRRFLNGAAVVHCTAEAECTQARRWFDNRSTVVLPCIINLSSFEHLPGPAAGLSLLPAQHRAKMKILFLSRLHEKKGVDILIRAAGSLRDRPGMPPFVVVLAGTGEPAYEQLLRSMVAELGLEPHVCFLGLVTGQVKVSLYQASDVFALPTLQENFGLVLAEAMGCGLCVVTTRGTDVWQEVQQAGGQIVAATPEAFGHALEQLLLASSEHRGALGARGRDWVLSTFSEQAMGETYETLYRTARAGGPRSEAPAGVRVGV